LKQYCFNGGPYFLDAREFLDENFWQESWMNINGQMVFWMNEAAISYVG